MWEQIAAAISAATQTSFEIQDQRSVGGGSVNRAYAVLGQVDRQERAYFVKLNQAERLSMFEAEALGLRELADSQTVRVPLPICWGRTAESGTASAYIVLEWLELGYADAAAWEQMGRDLAALHRVTSPRGFGWSQPNTIGFTPQPNDWRADWCEFFMELRLEHQLRLAQRQGGRFPQQQQLMAAVPEILAGHRPQPSLVHGDLWTGNAAVTGQGEPVIFDPATYFGDREVDLAMSELFGRFPAEFYRAYAAAFPLSPGYDQRKQLYNLYHILNHFNQFGGSYEAEANRMIAALLSA